MRFNTLQRAVEGLFIKGLIELCFLFKIKPGKLMEDNDIVVSLTSYGRRVKASAPYTIYWLFKQKKRPSRIILWLDEVCWNENNLPSEIKFLKCHGLEVRFCKDIKSYKKLIYTLAICRKSKIVTIDDDVLYYRNLIRELSIKSFMYPYAVIAMRYHQPAWNVKGKSLLPYRKWKLADESMKHKYPMATGVGGVLYPPHCFNDEVMNEEVFMKICPTADDVWFWCMAIFSGTKIVGIGKDMYYPIDAFYQNLHKGSALEHLNVENCSNDTQIKAVFDYYNLWNKA